MFFEVNNRTVLLKSKLKRNINFLKFHFSNKINELGRNCQPSPSVLHHKMVGELLRSIERKHYWKHQRLFSTDNSNQTSSHSWLTCGIPWLVWIHCWQKYRCATARPLLSFLLKVIQLWLIYFMGRNTQLLVKFKQFPERRLNTKLISRWVKCGDSHSKQNTSKENYDIFPTWH